MALFKPDQFIVSVVTQNIRSTGDIFQSGVSQSPYYQIDTYFADTVEINAITQSVVSNPAMTSFVGAMSLDGLYVPYSTYAGHTGLLPHFETPTSTGEIVNSLSLNPFNPSGLFGSGAKNTGSTDNGTYLPNVWRSGGHNITAALTVSEHATNTTMNSGIHPVSNAFDADFHYRQKTELNEIRGVAHRTPMILSGWGYDTNEVPVPTGVTPATSGLMHTEALWNTALWKTGPLDVRWDDGRKVWTGGNGGCKIISFQIISSTPAVGTRGISVSVEQKSFQGAVYGSYLGDTVVDAYDTDGCYINEPNVDLTARRGKAVLMYVDNDAILTHWSGYSYSAIPTQYWNILSICCPNLDCDS